MCAFVGTRVGSRLLWWPIKRGPFYIYISLQLLLVDFDRSPARSSRPLDRLFSAQRSERTICPLLSLGLGPQPPPTRIYRENGCTAVCAHYSWSAIAFLISWTGVLYIRYARLTPKGLMDGLRYPGFPFLKFLYYWFLWPIEPYSFNEYQSLSIIRFLENWSHPKKEFNPIPYCRRRMPIMVSADKNLGTKTVIFN